MTPAFFFCLLLYKWVDPVWFHALPTSSLISCTGCFRYKDNPFTVGDSFGSRWDTEGGTASFTTSWALEKEDPKEEVTISSIQPIGERYLHPLCLLFFKTRRQCWLDCDQLWCAVPCLIQTSQQKKSRGVGSGVRVERGQTEVCKCEGDLFGHVLWSRDQRRGEKLQITELQNHFCPAAVCFIKVSELCRVLTQIFTLISSSLSTMQRRDWRTCLAAPPSVQPTCSGTAVIKVKPVCFVYVCAANILYWSTTVMKRPWQLMWESKAHFFLWRRTSCIFV